MNEQLRESISALIDGEATELELRRIIHETENRNDVMHIWRRYHHYRSIMANEQSAFSCIDISQRVSAVLEKEQESVAIEDDISVDTAGAFNKHKQDIPIQQIPWVKSLSRISIAASVAFVTVLGVKSIQLAHDTGGIDAGIADAGSTSQLSPTVQIKNQPVRVDLAAQKRLGEYVKIHASKDAYHLQDDDFETHLAKYKIETD